MKFRSTVVVAVLAMVSMAACSGVDEGSSGPESTQAEGDTAENTAENVDSETLTLTSNTDTNVSGSLVSADGSISFELEKTGNTHVVAFYAGDGTEMLRTTYDGKTEKLQLGGVTLEGPRGSLLSGAEPNWELVKVSGDLSSAREMAMHPDLQLASKVVEKLSARADVNAAVLPEGLELKVDAPEGSWPSSTLQSHDPEGCAVCHVVCSASVLACVAATWGVFAWLCAAPGIVCHIGCAGSACQ